MNRTPDGILREALAQYADTANWMPTHINSETGDMVHLFWCAAERKSGGNGWEVAEDALREAEEHSGDLGALQKVALAVQEFLNLGVVTQANVWRKAELHDRLIEVLAEAGYHVDGVRPFGNGI
jgi:hypothetical protein